MELYLLFKKYQLKQMEETKTNNNSSEAYYICKNCNWQGKESELDWDETETCAGPDKIEICPKCGSMDVRIVFD